MKIVSIVGARPEFIQAMPVSYALRPHHQEILVHTGQHYDYQMSQTFFDELSIPSPDYNLEVGSGSHAKQSAEIMVRLEEVLHNENPDLVIVRGDTNSTLAGAITASKMQIPTAHIEAGERSYDRRMPEEINRLVADVLADLHFCASKAAIKRLADEGIVGHVYWVGDVMLDALVSARKIASQKSAILARLKLHPKQYSLVTVHRAGNTDDPHRLTQIISALNQTDERIIFPAHPRTLKALTKIGAEFADTVSVIDPIGYFDMLVLEENARLIATDSGGVQREAYFLGVPCLTLRDETEWTETVTAGWNCIVGVNPAEILAAWHTFSPPGDQPPIFGDGNAGEKIAMILTQQNIIFGHQGGTHNRTHNPLINRGDFR